MMLKVMNRYSQRVKSLVLRNLVTLSLLTCPNHALLASTIMTNQRYSSSDTTTFFDRPRIITTSLVKTRTFGINKRSIHSNNNNKASFMKRSMSSSMSDTNNIRNIGKEEMEEIIEDYEYGGRADSEYLVIDVRTDEEVLYTGKLSESVYTLPVQVIMEYNVFALENEQFEEICGFEKPTPDETIVFTCKAGIRSVYACQFAAKAGYSKLINYVGGSTEWFATGGLSSRNMDD